MEQFLQISAVCVIGCICAVSLKKSTPEFSFCLILICCAAAAAAAGQIISPVIAFLEQLHRLTGLQDAILLPLLKTVGIGILTQITGGFCADAGEQSLARVVEISGAFLAVYVSLPLANSFLLLIETLLGG